MMNVVTSMDSRESCSFRRTLEHACLAISIKETKRNDKQVFHCLGGSRTRSMDYKSIASDRRNHVFTGKISESRISVESTSLDVEAVTPNWFCHVSSSI